MTDPSTTRSRLRPQAGPLNVVEAAVSFLAMPARPHVKHLHQSDSCGERGCGSGEVAGDAGDDGEGGWESAASEEGALRGEGEEPEDDLVSAGSIDVKIAFEWSGSCWPWNGDGV